MYYNKLLPKKVTYKKGRYLLLYMYAYLVPAICSILNLNTHTFIITFPSYFDFKEIFLVGAHHTTLHTALYYE